jgi:hypothetical protein
MRLAVRDDHRRPGHQVVYRGRCGRRRGGRRGGCWAWASRRRWRRTWRTGWVADRSDELFMTAGISARDAAAA